MDCYTVEYHYLAEKRQIIDLLSQITTTYRTMISSLVRLRQPTEVFFATEDLVQSRQLQRNAQTGVLFRIASGIYVLNGDTEEIEGRVKRNWQRIAGHLFPGAVVSHISAFSQGLTKDGYLTLSHPTRFNKSIQLPGVTLILLKGPLHIHGDFALGDSGLYWSSQSRTLLENLGRSLKNRPTRAGKAAVEERLASILNVDKEEGLNRVRDNAREIAPAMGAESAFNELNVLISALLKTHSQGVLKTKSGQLIVKGTPTDTERQFRFEVLASALRTTPLPRIKEIAGDGQEKINFAFIESYFSNYVEGTRFSIEEAQGIVLRNQIIESRPKDSHDILGVFNQATQSSFRDTLPPPGSGFLTGLQERHRTMLSRRPEASPGELKTQTNWAGTTQFVEPEFVRGTMEAGSQIALTIPEGLARAIFYAFLISEIHPFVDGNGRLSRLTMNAELSRLGLCRVIIPTLCHPQYVDCQKVLTQNNDAVGFIAAIRKMAEWCSQFDYSDVDALIKNLRACNAFEESPTRFKLLNI